MPFVPAGGDAGALATMAGRAHPTDSWASAVARSASDWASAGPLAPAAESSNWEAMALTFCVQARVDATVDVVSLAGRSAAVATC